MNKRSCFHSLTALVLSLILAGAVFAQNAPAKKTLVVNGRTADAAVVQIDGHSYVDVDTFARMINPAVTFEPGRVLLTVPAPKPAPNRSVPRPGCRRGFPR